MEYALMAAVLAPLNTEAANGFAPDLAAFLAPLQIEGEGPAGPPLRYDPVYSRIRDARMEEDASLPMGEWTRPLKKADWRATEMLCAEVLQRRSKDLQVAAWLTEAWVHRHAIDGLIAGTRLLEGLARDFWQDVHPCIGEDGDADMRTATFVWLNDTLAQTLLMRVPLLAWPDFSPPFINLGDWQRALTTEFGAGAGNTKSKAKEVAAEPSAQTVSRQDILDQAARDLHALAALDDRVTLAADAWRDLGALLDERLGADAPSLSKVTEMLLRMRQALRSLLQERDPRDEEPPAMPMEPPASWAADTSTLSATSMDDNDMSEAPSPPPSLSPSAPLPQAAASGRIGSRAEAYQLLELAAAYLLREEPHSPTPYLVNRAVAWGRMPLPQLMQEVLREDGDLNRYFSIIGVRPDA
ncbi:MULTISPECIES: type VI secretion system protein TssA [Variovorax]|jgi:type VI secretion system protein ImpA|uniref:type VI secretion system protein TssA n=1 Tax=Variovorax TaxID=34072 RepID=UPI00210D96F6|nr:type VI secretion system protein TssA [Variovorax sp. OV084]